MSPPGAETTLHAIVHGRVQGVGYRFFVADRAGELELKGMTRNLPDGTVEVRARGARENLERLAEQLRRGPALARVTGVQVRWDLPLEAYEDFSVGY